jgi:hypothetical protein
MGSFIFKSGKHIGKSLDWVEEFDSGYLNWVKENRPQMLKETSTPIKKNKKDNELPDSPISAIKPNMDFDNEKKEE